MNCFHPQPPEKPERPCSARYLNVLVSGARSAGLDGAYVERLAKTPTYAPSAATLELRAALRRVAPRSLQVRSYKSFSPIASPGFNT